MTNRVRHEELVFLLDVDNTLLDNDRFGADLSAHLKSNFGVAERDRYWAGFAALRAQTGCADYLAALQRFRTGLENEPALLHMSTWLLEYPFADRLYPGALEAIGHLRSFGRPVILSDGEVVFQPRKIQRSGLWEALHGDVLIYLHKELALDAVARRFPATHYVMIDDKPQLLAAMKRTLGAKLGTIWVRQGKYASAEAINSASVPPDRCIDAIGELCGFNRTGFASA